MDEKTFAHFLQELRDSAQTGDVTKLLVQAGYFEEMTLVQQMEAGNLARQHVSAKLFLNVYRAVVEKNLLARRNPVLRKLLKEAFLADHLVLREAALMVPVSDSMAVAFMEACLSESGDPELIRLFAEKQMSNQTATENRVSELAQIQKMSDSGADESVASMMKNAGNDVGIDIVLITKLAAIKTAAAMKALTFFLGLPSSKVRGYAAVKCESLGNAIAEILILELADAVAHPNADKSITILTILKKVAGRENMRALRKVGRSMPNHVNMRVAFYETLVNIDPDGTAPLLVEQICDGVDDIAYSAASLLDSNCNEHVIQGVRNFIESSLVSLKRLVEIVVFSRAKNLASKLSADTAFFTELTRMCSLEGMEEYSAFFGLSERPEVALEQAPVWVVDDSKMILRMYDRFAMEYGIALKSFESGNLMIEAMAEPKPSLIFLDLNMPELNGVDVANKLNEKGWGDIPRVLVTTQEDAGADIEIQKGLFREIVLKPFTPDILTKVANRYL